MAFCFVWWPTSAVVVRRSFVRSSIKVNGSYIISRTVFFTLNQQFSQDQPHRSFYSHTGYDVTSYFLSEVIAKKNCRRLRLRRLWVKFLQNGLCEDHEILHTYRVGNNQPHKCAEYYSLAASGQLQNAIKYWQKWVNGCGRQRFEKFTKCLTQNQPFLHGHPCRPTL